MPDICMCDNHECEKKKTCYRYIAKPNPYRQTYATFKNKGDYHCYWPCKNESDVRKYDLQHEGEI